MKVNRLHLLPYGPRLRKRTSTANSPLLEAQNDVLQSTICHVADGRGFGHVRSVLIRQAADPTPKLVTEHFMIDAVDPGMKLYVRNKRPEDMTQFTSEKTLLFVHGATQPAEATFDLPLEGLSWMDYIAQHGWDVYLVDVRGYGRSTRPPEMDQPAASNPPIVTTDVAVKDVGSAIDFILQRRGVSKLSLMGWSWGTVIMGAYTADHNDKVERLVLYAPVWLQDPTALANCAPPLGAYVAARWRPRGSACKPAHPMIARTT